MYNLHLPSEKKDNGTNWTLYEDGTVSIRWDFAGALARTVTVNPNELTKLRNWLTDVFDSANSDVAIITAEPRHFRIKAHANLRDTVHITLLQREGPGQIFAGHELVLKQDTGARVLHDFLCEILDPVNAPHKKLRAEQMPSFGL